jgi:hypothetical protein
MASGRQKDTFPCGRAPPPALPKPQPPPPPAARPVSHPNAPRPPAGPSPARPAPRAHQLPLVQELSAAEVNHFEHAAAAARVKHDVLGPLGRGALGEGGLGGAVRGVGRTRARVTASGWGLRAAETGAQPAGVAWLRRQNSTHHACSALTRKGPGARDANKRQRPSPSPVPLPLPVPLPSSRPLYVHVCHALCVGVRDEEQQRARDGGGLRLRKAPACGYVVKKLPACGGGAVW